MSVIFAVVRVRLEVNDCPTFAKRCPQRAKNQCYDVAVVRFRRVASIAATTGA
jgi:hypothetical protein